VATYRRNEDRFYRYPTDRIVAIVDDEPSLEAALAGLEEAGIDLSEVVVLSGPEGERLLDPTGERHGLRGQMLRMRQTGGYEADLLQEHAQALRGGRQVFYVPVTDDDERARAIRTLRAAGGRHLVHFRAWTIEEIR
jgi:hypothetical protein